MKQKMDDARYDSISDFLSGLQSEPYNDKNKPVWQSYAFEGRQGANWYGAGCNSGNDVQAKMITGWDEGRKRLDDLRNKMGELDLAPVDRRRRVVRADQGDSLDMVQVYAGRLDIAWTTPRRKTVYAPQKVEILANMICSGADHPDVLFWRGAAAAVLADVLETAGYMVRLVVGFGGSAYPSKGTEKVSCRITVKEHGCPLDVTSTSAVIMPGFFRALGHGWIAGHCEGHITSPGISVGQCEIDTGEILLSHKVFDHATALAFINDTIADLNSGRMVA
jgi:hypothetical protein